MAESAAIALAKAASTIYAAAQTHKRLAAQHRNHTRLLMEEFDRLRRDCAAAGVDIQITETPRRAS